MVQASRKLFNFVIVNESDFGVLRSSLGKLNQPTILAVQAVSFTKFVARHGNDARFCQLLDFYDLENSDTNASRYIRDLVANGSLRNAEIWSYGQPKALRFNPEFKTPRFAATYPMYRCLRKLGFEEISYRGAGWRVEIDPFELLDEFRGRHTGKRCFIAGNGPSLNSINMTLLGDEITFGSNRCFLGYESWGMEFSYWAIEDKLQIEKYLKDYQLGVPSHVRKFIPFDYVEYANFENVTYFPLMSGDGRTYPNGLFYPAFSSRPPTLYHGFSVTYSLIQLAVLMGCTEIYLIGVDHNYSLPKRISGLGGRNATWTIDDSSRDTHFDRRYTTEKKEFIQPRPIHSEMAYDNARGWCEFNGVAIKNATPGSWLDVFETINFEDLF
jgi:hypothetical protein